VREAAKLLDLEAYLDRKPRNLSGGQRQRVAMGRAIVRHPQVYLMDEPLSNLDAKLRVQTRAELVELQERLAVTTVYVTHDQSEAMATADLIVVLNAGRVEQAGTPEEIALRPRSEFVARFVGGTNVIPGSFVGRPGTVAIRLEDVGLFGARPDFEGNVAEGTVVRRVFLGGARDYVVETGGEQIRVTAPLSVDVPLGERVWLYFPPERCRALESAADGGRQRCRV
jgi:iron(III) transport system ATP-binding protein